MSERRGRKVLFVDSEPVICSIATDFLEIHGFNVDTYENSRDALEAFRKDPDNYDIVITDQLMPELSGVELLKNIAEIRSAVPRILCTGFSDDLNQKERNEVEIDALFMKPYRFDDLVGQIERLV